MANTIAANGATTKNSSNACPNAGQSGHTPSTAPSGRLTSAQVRQALNMIDTAPGSRLARYAKYRAFAADMDADDLLQEAIFRAMASRSCPAHIAMEHFLLGVMRSIASKVIEKRERADDALRHYGRAYPNAPLAPDEALVLAERAEVSQRLVERVVAGSVANVVMFRGGSGGRSGLL